MIFENRNQNYRQVFKTSYTKFIVFPRLLVWTDCSESSDQSTTTTGFVIKDEYHNWPPLIGSNVYDKEHPLIIDSHKYERIHNSKGEVMAGIESLNALIDYCDVFRLNPKECVIEMKTDFNYLKRIINGKFNKNEENKEKKILIDELRKVQKKFNKVNCEEIERCTNIAHNICLFKMREYTGNESYNRIIKSFYDIYENPEELCIIKVPALA